MSIKNLLTSDKFDLRYKHILNYVNEKYNYNVERNPNEKSNFKWVDGNKLVSISSCPYKTIIPINMKYIKEGLKDNKEMLFIFEDKIENIIYEWAYDEKHIIVNFNYNHKNLDIEYVSIFKKNTKILSSP